MNKYIQVSLLIGIILFCSCEAREMEQASSVWENEAMWFQTQQKVDQNKIDVLYLISTEVISSKDEDGNDSWRATLTDAEKENMTAEMGWVNKNMFDTDFNFFSPYYHEVTFDAIIKLSSAEYDSVYQEVVKEVFDAFDYYMANINNGRPFVLAGFSQGAMLSLDLLKHMSDEEYSRMRACYAIGYRLSVKDLQHPHIKAAQGETDRGVVISFNSVQNLEAIWPLVTEGACTCINPVNWKTDSTPATFTFEGTFNEVHVDQENNVLLVKTDNPSHYYEFMDMAKVFEYAGASRDNLHHWDLLFYNKQIHDNALKR